MTVPDKKEIVVITGATAGVGRATVQAFADQGAWIGLIARDPQRLEDTRKDVETRGGRALVLPTDVANADQVEAAAQTVEQEFGPIDIWINNAMTTVFSPFVDITPDEYKRVTEVTYLGYVYGTQSALQRMIPRNRGVIVQVGSALAYRAIPLQSAYCGAKHAMEGFTESVRSELIHNKNDIHITMVQMPALNTPQFTWCRSKMPRKSQPVPPIYQPEVAAQAIYWAAHHKRRQIYVGINTVIILWGNKFFPGFGDWYLAKTGFDSQMTDEPTDSNAPDDLFHPVQGPFGAHGAFDNRARNFSLQLWLDLHRGTAIVAGVACIALIAWLIGFLT